MSRLVRFSIVMFIIVIMGLTGACGVKNNSVGNNTGQEKDKNGSVEKHLMVYCGAGLRKPAEALGKKFQEKTGIIIDYSFGNAAQNVNQILTTDKGDAFIPGDMAELKPIREKEKIAAEKDVVLHTPVLAVPKGNPAGIKGLKDLTKPGIKVVLGDNKATPIGKLADKAFTKAGIMDQVEKNVVARTATANELFTYLSMKQADASIVWEDTVLDNDKIEVVPTQDLDKFIKTVGVVTLKSSQDAESSAKFAEFVSSDEGMAIWKQMGFKAAPAKR